MSRTTPRPAIRFRVEGMTCQSCVNRISRALRTLDGVRGVRVDLRRELVTVERSPGTVPDAAIADAVEGVGYHPRIHEAVDIEMTPTVLQRLLHH